MTWGQRRTLVILLVIAAVVLFIWIVPHWAFTSGGTISSNSVLVLDLNGSIEEQRAADLSSVFFGSQTLVLHEINDAIDSARIEWLKDIMYA